MYQRALEMVNETCGQISIKDVELNEEGEDIFFDSLDYLGTSFDPESSGSYPVENSEFKLRKIPYDFWMKELSTVHERCNKFFRETGFDKLILSQLECTKEPEVRHNVPLEQLELKLMLDSLSSPDHGGDDSSTCSTKVLDTEENLLGQNLGQNGVVEMLNEVGSNRTMTWQEIQNRSHFVQPFSGKEAKPDGVSRDRDLSENKKLSRRWWRRFTSKRNAGGMHKNDTLSGKSKLPKTLVKKEIHEGKNSMEIKEFRMVQEIIAHKGLIRTMKFSPCGMYLATGGEDCIVRIWQVRGVEASHNCLIADGSSSLLDGTEKLNLRRKGFNCASVVSPDEILQLEEIPLHEYLGHTSDILDLSWSKSDCLLSASKDKTVRMWNLGCKSCVKVFHHNDYVTCIQFNTIDDRYFISGSIDGKVRIWAVDENRVVDWVDMRSIITAISYQTDGKGFVVGTLAGNCRFYVYSGNNLQLDRELCIWGKNKLTGKQITGLLFFPGDSKKVMITSVDSKVRIFDGFEIVQKFGGSWKSKSHVAASFTSDGGYIVSIGGNSNVCIRDYGNSAIPLSKGVKSIYPCDHFFSEGVTVAVPWPSTEKRGAYSYKSCIHSFVPFEQVSESFTQCRHQYFFSLGSCFHASGTPSGSATWPEEKLPVTPIPSEQVDHNHMHHELSHLCRQCQESESLIAASSLVIVTGNCSGMIRLFSYSRLPVRFC